MSDFHPTTTATGKKRKKLAVDSAFETEKVEDEVRVFRGECLKVSCTPLGPQHIGKEERKGGRKEGLELHRKRKRKTKLSVVNRALKNQTGKAGKGESLQKRPALPGAIDVRSRARHHRLKPFQKKVLARRRRTKR